MEILPLTLTQKGVTYTQRHRAGMIAMYEQSHPTWETSRFEVIRVQESAAHEWPPGTFVSAKETYPTARTWGKEGWTFLTYEDAFAYFQALA